MILTQEQITPLLNEQGVYDCRLLISKIGVKLFGTDLSPLGNVLCFEAPTTVGNLNIKNALVLVAQTNYTNSFGGVCLQRLFAAQLGSILSQHFEVFCYVENGCIFIEDKQISIFMFTQVKDTISLQMVVSLDSDESCPLGNLGLTQKEVEDFKTKAVESFKFLTKEIFLETQRDNI